MRLSLIKKIPLRVSLLIIIVGCVVTASLLFRAYHVFQDDLRLSSENMGRILSRSLTNAMLQDDTWRAYEIINTPYNIESRRGALQADHVVVLDEDFLVYISTRPIDFPMLSDPTKQDPVLSTIINLLKSKSPPEQFTYDPSFIGQRYVVTPIHSDNVALGAVVMYYSPDIFIDRF